MKGIAGLIGIGKGFAVFAAIILLGAACSTDSTPQSTAPQDLASTPAGDSAGRIAFSSNRDGDFEIYVMNADGSGQTRLTSNSVHDFRPAWSPDGEQIAFGVLVSDSNAEVYVMNADGSGRTRLTNDPAGDSAASWQP